MKLRKSVLEDLLIHHSVCNEEAFIRISDHSNYWFANIEPIEAAVAFKKYECFCFTEQTLKANSEVHMKPSGLGLESIHSSINSFKYALK